MKQPTRSMLDPKQIYLHGFSFQWANERLRDVKHIQPHEVGMVAHPSMVLSALASELYLKCLICIETGKVPDTHNLKHLFRQIDRRHQEHLKALWDSHIQEPDKLQTLALIEMKTNQKLPRDLNWALEVGSNAFVQMRYIYEPSGANTKFLLGDFPKLLQVVILEIKPEWASLRRTPTILPDETATHGQ